MLDTSLLAEHIASGFVRETYHPSEPLALLTYTQKAQNNWHWDDVIEQCRGLIYNVETEEIVARPFRKFFNMNEAGAFVPDPLGNERVIAFDKIDGSLGIAYRLPSDNSWAIATRGSFTSEQALHATELLHSKYPWHQRVFNDVLTPLFEIIYPENRIVVGYEGRDELVHLGHIAKDSGEFFPPQGGYGGFPHTEKLFQGLLKDFTLPVRDNAEGVVLWFPARDDRLKVKYEEYVKLHRIVTGLNKRTIWEMMLPEKATQFVSNAEFINKLPEEHQIWAKEVQEELLAAVIMEHMRLTEILMHISSCAMSRKEVALAIANEPGHIKSSVFAALDNRPFLPILWKYVKPASDNLR